MADMNPRTAETQLTRRVKYGLNVTVAIVAAILIAVLINWIGDLQYWRTDLTSSRRYSLSEQTIKVLGDLDNDYQIVTLLPPADSVQDPRLSSIIQQATDITDEYARRSNNVTVDHLSPGLQITRIEAFYESLRDRYAGKLEPVVAAIEVGRDAIRTMRGRAGQLIGPLSALLEDQTLEDDKLKRFTESVARHFARFTSDLAAIDKQIGQSLDSPLPNYDAAKTTLTRLLGDVDTGVFEVAIEEFNKAVKHDQTPDAIKNRLLELVELFESVREPIQSAKREIDAAESADEYNRLIDRMGTTENIIVIGPTDVQVVPLDNLFRAPDPTQVQRGQFPELRFQGEEKITGSLLSMSMKNPPLIVFVNSGPGPATGPGGGYQQVANRLKNFNFDLQQWNPSGQPGPMGRPMPPGPAPQPKSGQKAVWVVLPSPPPDPRNPMGAGGSQQVATTIEQRLNDGDSALFLLAWNPMSFMASSDAITQLIEPWGITAQTDRGILAEVRLPDHRPGANFRFDTFMWSDATPITDAIHGMQGHFELPSPLVIGKPDGSSGEVWPLVEIAGNRLWAASNLQSSMPEYDESTAADSFVIGAAAEKADNRIVVFTGSHDRSSGIRGWASDLSTNYGMMGPGTAEIFGSAWPANAELFVNSVLWLAGLEDLIAASARSQDVRRVGDLTRGGLTGLRWTLMAGLPLVTFGAGIGVWMTRRKG